MAWSRPAAAEDTEEAGVRPPLATVPPGEQRGGGEGRLWVQEGAVGNISRVTDDGWEAMTFYQFCHSFIQ